MQAYRLPELLPYGFSIFSLIISIVALYVTYKCNKKALELNNRNDHLLSMIQVENTLQNVSSALRFHGIEVADLEKTGVSVNEFVYLLNSFTSASIYFADTDIDDRPFKKESYRYKMLLNPDVQKVWPYLSKMIEPSKYKMKIENTLMEINKKQEKINRKSESDHAN